MNHRIFFLIITILVGGCSTGYGPDGLYGGYKERAVDEDSYIVSFESFGHTTSQQVWNYWIFRCAELTLEKGHQFFELVPTTETAYNLPSEILQPIMFTMLPFVKVNNNLIKPVRYQVTYSAGTPNYLSSGLVNMYSLPVPQSAGMVLDAKAIVTVLKDYVSSRGGIKPPEKKDLIIRAAVEAAIRANRIEKDEVSKMKEVLEKNLNI